MDLNYRVEARCSETQARTGRFRTTHNEVETPQFMPVGTMASVKGVDPQALVDLGATVILGNTYHLGIRPGVPVLEALGGMHTMACWPRSILTDSGGFQILSLAKLRRVDEDGVKFRNHIDGGLLDLTPEHSIAIQAAIGSDIAMCLDHLAPSDSPREVIEAAMARTTRWAARCLEARSRADQALFAIVQGGIDLDLRAAHVDALSAMPFDGYALGGLAVGESIADMDRTVEFAAPRLPEDKPRYLMGVGTPRDLVESVARGVDLFDCVMPTRNARKGGLFVDRGRRKVNLNNARFRTDAGPVDPGCVCPTCTRFSAGYLRHLLVSKELLAYGLLSVHNLHVYLSLMREMRAAIRAGGFAAWRAAWHGGTEG